MEKLALGNSLLVASHNAGKIDEFRQLLTPLGVEVKGAVDYNLVEPEETGSTFAENALLKARIAAKATGISAIADDSGLCAHGLGGRPGLYSARWAKPEMYGSFQNVFDYMAHALAPSGNYGAEFVCVIAHVTPQGEEKIFQGIARGTLIFPPRGNRGFGYDPIFQPDGHTQTFAEMEDGLKNSLSHRGLAMRKFLEACR